MKYNLWLMSASLTWLVRVNATSSHARLRFDRAPAHGDGPCIKGYKALPKRSRSAFALALGLALHMQGQQDTESSGDAS